MSRGTWAFRQRDVTRAIKAARAAGWNNVRIEIDPRGNISIIPQTDDEATQGANEWDSVQ